MSFHDAFLLKSTIRINACRKNNTSVVTAHIVYLKESRGSGNHGNDVARGRLVAKLLVDDMSLRKLPTLPFHSRDDSKSDNGSSDDVHHSVGWPMTGCSSSQCGKEWEDGFLKTTTV